MTAMPAPGRLLLAPLAVFGAVLAAMVALNGSATAPPALSAGGDIGRPSGEPGPRRAGRGRRRARQRHRASRARGRLPRARA